MMNTLDDHADEDRQVKETTAASGEEEPPQPTRSIRELYEQMFPGCLNGDAVEKRLQRYTAVDEKTTTTPPSDQWLPWGDCENQTVYDALDPDPRWKYVFIAGYPYRNDHNFPDPDKLIFVISGDRSIYRASSNDYDCTSYESIKREFFRATLESRVENIGEANAFVVCQWFLSFVHCARFILLKEPVDFVEWCDCDFWKR